MVPGCTSSGLQASSAVIAARRCQLVAVTLIQAAAAATLIVYDNKTTNSGTVVAQINTTVNASSITLSFNYPIEANNGLYAALTGTSAGYILHFIYT